MTDKKLPATTIDLFTKTATWQSWLNVEGALAQAQGPATAQGTYDDVI